MLKDSSQQRRVSKSQSSDPLPVISPILAAVEQPVTTRQLASHLQCSERTIANYRSQGIIPYWRVTARRILYRISDVERHLSEKK